MRGAGDSKRDGGGVAEVLVDNPYGLLVRWRAAPAESGTTRADPGASGQTHQEDDAKQALRQRSHASRGPLPQPTSVEREALVGKADAGQTLLVFRRNPSIHSVLTFYFLLVAGISATGYAWLWLLQPITALFVLSSGVALAVSFAPEKQWAILSPSAISRSSTMALFPDAAQPPNLATEIGRLLSEGKRYTYTAPMCCIRVREELLRYVGRGRQVVIDLEDGTEVPLTSFCTLDPRSSHQEVMERVAAELSVDVFEPEDHSQQDRDPPGQGFAGSLERLLRDKFRPVEE